MGENTGLALSQISWIMVTDFNRERLRGNWGVAEVADAARTVKELGERGLIDPARATIRGGSAGEYQVLFFEPQSLIKRRRIHCSDDVVHT
jgi:hypothetical protein